jgi:hypothetical protein
VVEAIMAQSALLPARFGTTFTDEAALDEVLARNHAALAAGLDHVAGCVELGVRALWRGASDIAESSRDAVSGRGYMQARLAIERERQAMKRRAEDVADRVHAQLVDLAKDSARRVLVTPDMPLTAAYLVSRDQVDAFARRVEAAGAAQSDVRLLCTGPWPPYHFTPALPHAEVARA